jgi:hypothetical protein
MSLVWRTEDEQHSMRLEHEISRVDFATQQSHRHLSLVLAF